MRRPLLLLCAALVAGGVATTASANPTNTTPPSIHGTPAVGATLTADPGQWTGRGTITYQYAWLVCNSQGGDCGPLHTTGPTLKVTAQQAGESVRVTVTATDADGSTQATSDPVVIAKQTATIKLLSPKPGAITTKRRVKVVVRVTATVPIHSVSLQNSPMRRGKGNTWWRTIRPRPGAQRFEIEVDLGGQRPVAKSFSFSYYPSVGIASPDSPEATLGCNPCSFKDKRGDAHGGPDIAKVRAIATRSAIRVTITTANSSSSGGGVTCAFFKAPGHDPHRASGSIDCYGQKINNGRVGSDRPAYLAHPNAHTTVVGLSLATIRQPPYDVINPAYLLVGIWTHGSADRQFDRFPNGGFASEGKYIKLQITKH